MIRATALVLLALVPTCQAGETGAVGTTWQLTELAGAPFEASATLAFQSDTRIGGRAPCNGYSARMTAVYPMFQAGPILSTKMACPTLPQETAFFQALAAMSHSEMLGDMLTLRNNAGLEMVFKASE